MRTAIKKQRRKREQSKRQPDPTAEEVVMRIMSEEVVSLPDASQLFPVKPDPSTMWRWARIGCRGVKLESIKMGKNYYTSRQAVTRFLVATQEPTDEA